jgi:hypothetical protein
MNSHCSTRVLLRGLRDSLYDKVIIMSCLGWCHWPAWHVQHLEVHIIVMVEASCCQHSGCDVHSEDSGSEVHSEEGSLKLVAIATCQCLHNGCSW